MYPEHWYRITPVRGYCGVSSFETREVGTVRSSLRFCWQRGSSVPEWSWQEKRKRALPEGNPPGISCRRLIPMSPGEMGARVFSPSSFLKSGNASTSAFVVNCIGIDLLMPSKTQGRHYAGCRGTRCNPRLRLFECER